MKITYQDKQAKQVVGWESIRYLISLLSLEREDINEIEVRSANLFLDEKVAILYFYVSGMTKTFINALPESAAQRCLNAGWMRLNSK